jgi:hypothetical protein
MSEDKKHALRCETCKNINCRINYTTPEDQITLSFDPHSELENTMSFVQGISQVGCASHSEACEISNANILGEERNKVLEKMISILAAHTLYSDNFEKDKIKGGWILVGGYEPIVEDIELLAGKTKGD